MADDSDPFTSYIDSTSKPVKRTKQTVTVIDEFASMLQNSLVPDSTFITINNKTTESKIQKEYDSSYIDPHRPTQGETNTEISDVPEFSVNSIGLNGMKVIEVECDNLTDLRETFGTEKYKNLDKTDQETEKIDFFFTEPVETNTPVPFNEQSTTYLPSTYNYQSLFPIKSEKQEDLPLVEQKFSRKETSDKENQNQFNENKTTEEEVNDEEITNHLKKIDFLIKKNSDQKTIKSLEQQLIEQKEKEKSHKNLQESLNKQIKDLTTENNELKRDNEILKILSKEIYQKSGKNADNLKNNYEIMEALEVGRGRLDFLTKSYEIEKQNFQLDISDLKKEVIRVNRDNFFLKTIVKELSMKFEQTDKDEENE